MDGTDAIFEGGGRGWPSREPKRLRDAIKTDPGVPKGPRVHYGIMEQKESKGWAPREPKDRTIPRTSKGIPTGGPQGTPVDIICFLGPPGDKQLSISFWCNM